MMKKILAALLSVTMCLTAILGLFSLTSTGQISEIYLNELSYLSSSKAGWSEIKLNRSVNDGGLRLNNAGAPMSFARGVAAHADSIVEYDLSSLSAVRFTSYIGVCADGGNGNSSVDFEVKVDGVSLYKSPTLYVDSKAILVNVAIPQGAQTLTLLTTGAGDGNNSDHTAWLDAKLYTISGGALATDVSFASEQYTLSAGSGMKLTTTASPAGALTGDVIYSVENGDIASVTPDGYVFGKGLGATTVKAYYPVLDLTATATLRVCADGNYTLDEQTWEVREGSDDPITRDYPADNMATLPITYGNTNQDIGSSLLMPAPEGDFEITVKVSGGLIYDYQLVGLVAYTGPASMVTVARRYHTYFGGNVFCASTYVDGYDDRSTSDPAPAQDAYLKMTKSGNSFTGYYSFDGAEWTKMSDSIVSEIGGSDELKIGITAMTSSGGYVPVLFTDFTLNGEEIPFSIKSSDLTMKVAAGKTVQTVSSLLGSGEYGDLSYEVADTTLATVDEKGLVTGIKPGVTVLTATKGSESQSFLLQVFSDKMNAFDEDTWQIVNPNGNPPSFDGITAVIGIPTGDFGADRTISNMVLLTPTTEDFDIRVKVSGGLDSNFESIGLVAYANAQNGVAMERRSHSYFGGNVFCLTDYENGGNEPYVADPEKDTEAWVRLVKEGNKFTGYYSYDGESWTAVADAQENVTVGTCESLKVGLIARSGSYGSDKRGTYSEFYYNGTLIPFCVSDKACIAYSDEIYRLPVDADASALPEELLCYMASGDYADLAVEWNTEKADFTRPGVYEIEGSVDGLTVKALLVVGQDLDGDGRESISDVTALLNHLAGVEGVLTEGATADLNGDGEESIKDVNALLSLLAGN